MAAMAQRVRDAASKIKGEFAPMQIASALGEKDAVRVSKILGDMVKRGEIERIEYGRYRYIKYECARWKRPPVRMRIYRAMHIKGTFSSREVARLAESSKDLVWRIVRELLDGDAIERLFKKRNPNNQMEWVYRVKHRDNFYLQYIQSLQKE